MPEQTAVDLSKYAGRGGAWPAQSAAYAYGRYTLQADLHTMAQLGYGLDARSIPVSVLQNMQTNAAVYLAGRTISGIVRRPDLFTVKHADPRIIAETEEWLWPLLPVLTAAAARGFAYGTVAVIFDWERKTLRFVVPGKGDKKERKKKAVSSHFGEAFEIHPNDTTLELDAQGRVVSVTAVGESYPSSRVYVWAWDPEFGSALGQGALRRAWRPYCEYLIITLLRDKYLERSVDSPRVGFCPEGKVEVDGVEWENPAYINHLLMELRGSGAMVLPSIEFPNGGGRQYGVETLDVPDRSSVFEQALNQNESEMFLAFLVSATLSGGLDGVGGAASRTLDGMLREHVEDLANWVAQGLTEIVELVHRANYDPKKVTEPEVLATDVGKANARKILQDALRLANDNAKGEIALRLDVPGALDRLGLPVRGDPPEFPVGWGGDGQGGTPGRDKDPAGEREERREDATTEEGEEDTGAPRDDGGEQS